MNPRPLRCLSRHLLARAVPLALIVAVLAVVAPAAEAAPGTCTIFWKGTSSTAWETAANWSLTDGGANAGRLPNATDVVCKSTAPTRTDVVISSARTVAGMNFGTGSLTLLGGNLTVGSVASGAFDSTIRNIASNGFTLGGTASTTLTGPGDPVTPVNLVLAGAGPVAIGSGSALNYSALTVTNGKTLTNNGTMTPACASVSLNLGAKLDNFGTITIPPSCGGSTPFFSDGNVNTVLTNEPTGVLNLASTSFVDQSSIVWHNNGTVNAAAPDVYFQPSATDTGAYNIAAGSTLHQYGTITISPATVTGAGLLRSDAGGAIVGNGGSVPHLSVPNATITGALSSPDASLTGATFNGTGTFTVPSGGHAELTGVTLNDSYTVLNNGSLTSTCGFVSLNGTSKIDNFGTTDLTSNVGCGSSASISGPTGQSVNEPGGVLTMSATSFVDMSNVILRNNGQVNASSTDAYINPSATDTGSYNVVSGHLNNFGSITLTPGTVTGAGLLQTSSGTLTGAGGNVPHLNANGGIVTGDLSSDDVTFNGSQLTGPGRLTVNTGGTAALPGGLVLANGYDLENHGTMTVPSSLFPSGDNSVVDNFGTMLLGSGTQIFDNSPGGTFQLNNRATGTMTATCALTTQSVFLQRLSNSGTLETNKCDVTITPDSDLSAAGALTGSGTLKATTGQIRFDRSVTSNASTLVLGATGTFFDSSAATATALSALASNSGSLILNRTLNTAVAMANSGTVNVVAGTFRPTSYTQSAGSTVVASGAILRGGAAGTGAVQINGGNLSGGGSIQGPLTNGAVVQPGGGGTAMAVTGTYAQTAGGTFGVTVSGGITPGTDFSKLTSTATASLNGTLAISTSPSFDPAPGTSLRILEAGSRSGTFSSVTGIALPNNKYYNVVYDATGVSLVVAVDPKASVASASVAEGNAGTSTVSVAVTLDQASTRTVSYDFTTVDQTASAGSDYVTSAGTLTYAPGETTKNVSVTVNGDATVEPNETFLVRLSNPTNGTVQTNDGVVTITNDDFTDVLGITAVSPSTVGQFALNRAITITGTGFAPTSTITFSKTQVTPVAGSLVVVNPTTITMKINVARTAPLGAVDVTVTGPNGSSTCTGCLVVTPRATVTSATLATPTGPSFIGLGAKQREVIVSGTNFQPGARVAIAGANVLSTSYISSTQLEAVVSPQVTTAVGATTASVTNPDGGRDVCSCFAFGVRPVVSTVTPSTLHRGTSVDVTITGSNFVPGAKVLGPAGVVANFVRVLDANTITVNLSIASTTPLGSGKVLTVTNPLSAGYGVGTFNGLTTAS